MTAQQTILKGISKLQKSRTPSAHLDAEIILSHITNKSKEFLLAHPEHPISSAQLQKFNHAVTKRQRGIPMAYITGHKEFYGLDFAVDKNVLVPRPETELLIEEAIKTVRHLKLTKDSQDISLADIGTGSGCIAITLARYLPHIKIFAVDVSLPAVNVAQKNARTHKVAGRIDFSRGNLLAPLARKAKKNPLDIIVANLPYLTPDELASVRHEPTTALHGGKMGLELIDRLLAQADAVLAPDGVILLEIGPKQVRAVDYLIEQQLTNKHATVIKDLAGRDRVVRIS